MVFFRREKKKSRMQEKRVPAETTGESTPATSTESEIRVTDRRRINMDGEAERTGERAGEEPLSLKPKYVEELEARTREAEQKAQDVQARFEQLRAALQRETDETRQRLNRSADERARREKAEFISGLLPVADNLQRAIEASAAGSSLEAVLDGVRGTLNSFESVLLSAGVEPIESIGQPFDPERHEAVDTIEVEPERDGTVMAEYSRGYKMGDRLLRPARVQVGRSTSGRHEMAGGQPTA
jgi:molecular chaperone GrpE